MAQKFEERFERMHTHEYGDFWRGRGKELLFDSIGSKEILAFLVMIALLDKNALCKIEN